MRFWDSSALVPLVIEEQNSERVRELLRADSLVTVWWGSELECASALRRRERSGVDALQIQEAVDRLDQAVQDWHQVEPADELERSARRLLRLHDLSAAHALQLAAAVSASERRSETFEFVTLDGRLALAAEREGFPVLP